MAETNAAVRDCFLAALTRRRDALPPAARALIDARLEQGYARPASQPVTSASTPTTESPLAALVRDLHARTHDANLGGTAELKSAHYFRDSLSAFKVEQQIEAALAQWPENAGPLNSHLLVLQSLDVLRDSAPIYLRRFFEHIDTLFWLDALPDGTPPAKSKARGRKKR